MNSKKAQLINLPIRELLPAKSPADVMRLRARFQTAVETVSGHALQKLRLELTHSVSELLLTQRMGAMTMIAISIFCVLLICLFRLDLDDAETRG
jgi:hypothetical protein